MKMRKTPYKWAIGSSKMKPEIFDPCLETDDLGSQKIQNALKTGGVLRDQKMQKSIIGAHAAKTTQGVSSVFRGRV